MTTSWLRNIKPLGWSWNGVLHLAEGVTLEEYEAPSRQGVSATFLGKVVDHEGNTVKEADPYDWAEDDDDSV